MHLTDGELRAQLDEQLGPPGRLAPDQGGAHLDACPECQARLQTIAGRASLARDQLARLSHHTSTPEARAALARFQARLTRKDPAMLNRLFSPRLRPAWSLGALVITIAVALSFAPVRAWAGEFLGLFRVQQVTVLPVDTTGLGHFSGDETLTRQISQVLADSVTMLREPAGPQIVGGAAEASQLAGFNVRLPAAASTAPVLTVNEGPAFEFVVDRDRAQQLLDEVGQPGLQLPASVDGARIRVDIPTGVTAAYNCPADDEAQVPWSLRRKCLLLAQLPSPTVTAPPDLNVEQLAVIGLQFLGMSESDARAFSASVDWTTTLVIPVPQAAIKYSEVSVDGVTGTLLSQPANEDMPAHYALIWVRDGRVYGLTGFDDPAPGLALAVSLR